MGIFYIIFTFILFFLVLTLSLFMLRIFTGKSIRNPNYPPVKGTVFHQLFYFNRLYDYQTEVAKEHTTYRLLAPEHSAIYTTDTRNIEHVLKTNFGSYSKGEYNQAILSDVFGQGIFIVDGEKWKQQRKLASFEFSTRVLRDVSCSVFRRNAAKLVKVIFEISVSRRVFDMQDLLMRCTLDSIFKVGFGIDLNCLEGFLNLGSEASLKKYVKVIDDFVHQVIRSKRKFLEEQKDVNDKEDILSRFLLESKKDPEEMNDKYLRDIILNFMIAGKDTSANTLSWFFYLLSKNPLIQEKVVQEVRDVVGNQVGEAKIDEFVENITDGTLEQMHYLHAALTETLRLYPAVPIDGRCAEVDDILPDGFRVRKGDGVHYMAYAMGRMPYIWGKDVDDFRPERWLNNGIFQPESPFKFVTFHAGPRICLGKDFAYRQMKIVAMALLCFFRFKLADETKAVTYRTMFTLHIDGSLPMLAVPRAT
ncbi:unnamed protein product [Prunus armeniaca]|uniref:Cytochrome P450 n=1 Tax=Prunus armeniaca TaxID=36596 RepID=A0A6J5WLL5_PRUAR|nr:unnamed protein product [Prunus armeniaca]